MMELTPDLGESLIQVAILNEGSRIRNKISDFCKQNTPKGNVLTVLTPYCWKEEQVKVVGQALNRQP